MSPLLLSRGLAMMLVSICVSRSPEGADAAQTIAQAAPVPQMSTSDMMDILAPSKPGKGGGSPGGAPSRGPPMENSGAPPGGDVVVPGPKEGGPSCDSWFGPTALAAPPAPNPPRPPRLAENQCEFVCHHDKCGGTFTNGIPRGEQWNSIMYVAMTTGCCSLRQDQCEVCCPPEGYGEGEEVSSARDGGGRTALGRFGGGLAIGGALALAVIGGGLGCALSQRRGRRDESCDGAPMARVAIRVA